ncbi:hypothetical protein [Tahibacter caeni]|uniref:hypothetical protein n=1 Tax=Tahibacter caeni TaxID=1453545 RepID=UPI002147E7B8|nr:hypothetical protein [Tahibacter caeni]
MEGDDGYRMRKEEKHWNVAQQRVLRTLRVLVEHGNEGLLPGKVAELVGTIPSNATRDLANLRIAGLAQQIDERWYPAMVRVPARDAAHSAQRSSAQPK